MGLVRTRGPHNTTVPDVRSSDGGQEFSVHEAGKNGPLIVNICAADRSALLEVDGDGDGTDVDDVDTSGIGDGLIGAVMPDDLETRDGAKGESSRARGGEIVQGRYCERVRFN